MLCVSCNHPRLMVNGYDTSITNTASHCCTFLWFVVMLMFSLIQVEGTEVIEKIDVK